MNMERREKFLAWLNESGVLTAQKAVEISGASPATVRREFSRLEKSGLAVRAHGKLRRIVSDGNSILPLSLRGECRSSAKRAIARKAWEILQERGAESFHIHGGSTTLWLARMIERGMIVTNMPAFGEILTSRFPEGDGPMLVLTGGTLHYRSGILVGEHALESVRRYRCDVAVCSAFAVDSDGTSDINEDSIAVQREMFRCASFRMLLADSVKFRRKAFCRALDFSGVDLLVTDFDPENHDVCRRISALGCKVVFS